MLATDAAEEVAIIASAAALAVSFLPKLNLRIGITLPLNNNRFLI
jgi:hypothetical protein